MELSRRTFLKGTLAGGTEGSFLGFDLTPTYAQTQSLKISRATETRSTCPYCAVSCGIIIYPLGAKAKNAIPQEARAILAALPLPSAMCSMTSRP
jgi:formate dehydrogenase major subunit